jgi:hypothetical protein
MPLGDRAVIVTGDAFHQAATALKRRWRAGLFSALILVAACSGSPGEESPREAEVESPTEVTTVEDTIPLLDAIEIRGGQCSAPADELSVARVWNETVLAAIRRDFPAPTVHSRNLFHLSVAMWNVWAALDADGTQLLIDAPAFVAGDESDAIDAARVDAMSFAAHRLLTHRYANAEGASRSTHCCRTGAARSSRSIPRRPALPATGWRWPSRSSPRQSTMARSNVPPMKMPPTPR